MMNLECSRCVGESRSRWMSGHGFGRHLLNRDLPGALHGDPADRILGATARILRATLLTKDRSLLDYSRQHHVRTLSA
jgi:hypothetical protein